MPDRQNTPLRDRYICAKFRQIFTMARLRKSRSLRHISDAQARDIGLTPHEIECIRLKHPSQNMHHPRL